MLQHHLVNVHADLEAGGLDVELHIHRDQLLVVRELVLAWLGLGLGLGSALGLELALGL